MGESTSTYFLEFIKCRGTVHFSQPSADLLLSAYQYMHCVFSCNEHVSAIIQRNEFTQLLFQNLQSVPPIHMYINYDYQALEFSQHVSENV